MPRERSDSVEAIDLLSNTYVFDSLGRFSCGLARRVGRKIDIAAAMIFFKGVFGTVLVFSVPVHGCRTEVTEVPRYRY